MKHHSPKRVHRYVADLLANLFACNFGKPQLTCRNPSVVTYYDVRLGRSAMASSFVVGGPIWILSTVFVCVYALKEDVADVLVVACLRCLAKDIREDVDNSISILGQEIVLEWCFQRMRCRLGCFAPKVSEEQSVKESSCKLGLVFCS
jgi:hypothetical protein